MALTGEHFMVGARLGRLPWSSDCLFKNFTNCSFGIDGDLFMAMADILNFTYTLVPIETAASTPSFLPTTNLTNDSAVPSSLIGDSGQRQQTANLNELLPSSRSTYEKWEDIALTYLEKGMIDMTMNPIRFLYPRDNSSVQFAGPLLYSDQGYMMRQPIRDLRFLLTRPFSSRVWLCTFAATVAISCMTAFVWRDVFLHPKHRQLEVLTFKSIFEHIALSFWATTMISLQQSLPNSFYRRRRPYSHKALIGLWMGSSFVLASTYCAMLISVFLDVNIHEIPFHDSMGLAHLIKAGRYQLVLEEEQLADFHAWQRSHRNRSFMKPLLEALDDYPPAYYTDFRAVKYATF